MEVAKSDGRTRFSPFTIFLVSSASRFDQFFLTGWIDSNMTHDSDVIDDVRIASTQCVYFRILIYFSSISPKYIAFEFVYFFFDFYTSFVIVNHVSKKKLKISKILGFWVLKIELRHWIIHLFRVKLLAIHYSLSCCHDFTL